MVGRSLLALLLAIGLLTGLPSATATEEETSTHDTVPPSAHPMFHALPAAPEKVRLWAQMSSQGDAYFTLQPHVLAHPYTPAPEPTAPHALQFELFSPLSSSRSGDHTVYGSRPVRAAWDAAFHPGSEVVVHWRLSSGDRDVGTVGPAPPILVETNLLAIDPDGFTRVLGATTARLTLEPGPRPTDLEVRMPAPAEGVQRGERLVVTIDWSWAFAPGVGELRQPLIAVHPGSSVDLPLGDLIKVLSLRERVVLGDLYVRARIAHLFAVEALDLGGANMVFDGPSVSQGGRPFVAGGHDGPDADHVATFEWRVPVRLDNLDPGRYDLYVTARQAGEQGPRVIAVRTMEVEGATPGTIAGMAGSTLALMGLVASLGAVAGAVASRRF